VAHNQDVLHAQYLHGVLQHAEQVHIGVHHHVGDVAVHKHLAGARARDARGGHPRVGAANEEVARLLAVGQALEKLGVFRIFGSHPLAVIRHDILNTRHNVVE
jgi:hypothetical protein